MYKRKPPSPSTIRSLWMCVNHYSFLRNASNEHQTCIFNSLRLFAKGCTALHLYYIYEIQYLTCACSWLPKDNIQNLFVIPIMFSECAIRSGWKRIKKFLHFLHISSSQFAVWRRLLPLPFISNSIPPTKFSGKNYFMKMKQQCVWIEKEWSEEWCFISAMSGQLSQQKKKA